MKTWIVLLAVVSQVFLMAGAGWGAPFTRIVSPVQGQCVPGPDVVVKFEAGGMTLGPSGWNLHFMLDEEPFQVQYDGNHAHVFKNVMPGTHTVRVYAANAMQEAIPGTLSVVTFSVGYWDGANAPVQGAPLLTYNLPQGEYLGVDAGDITVDFMVSNATLSPNGYQVAYYVGGRRFLVQDHCGPRHVQGLEPGFHRVRIELQDQFGDVVPGAFNSTERVILVSPDSVTKSPSPINDGYDGLPRLDSVKGSMTMGQHWVATEPVRPLTEEDIEKQESLTVRRQGGETVGLRQATEGELAVVEGETGEFAVRQGGDPEETASLDAPMTGDAVPEASVSARRGSILVEPKEEDEIESLEDVGAPLNPTSRPEVEVDRDRNDEDVSATAATGESRVATEAAVTKEDAAETDDVKKGSIRVVKDEAASTRTAVRRRADGTTSTVRMTTETLKLDRGAGRDVERKTTSTVRVEDPGTTRARVTVERGDRETTRRAERRTGRNERRTTAPPEARLD